ncbi:MAG: helix-turn-helix transcriptional regulator [Planctomycetes bacterium]|nr:helix-turn-helix transcriptional regulator [Planctomycetota bacterium]
MAAWARYVYCKVHAPSVNDMAKRMKVEQTGLNRIIRGDRAPGIDFAVRLAVFSQESLDTLCLFDPPKCFFNCGIPPANSPLEHPIERRKK